MTAPRASVVIVSRGRPDTLCLCLAGVARLRNATYEVVVVADNVVPHERRPLDGLLSRWFRGIALRN